MSTPKANGVEAQQQWPRADLSRVPYDVYHSQEVINLERERIFEGATWSYLALEAELPEPGTFIVSSVGDIPVVVTRDEEGEIHAVVNRCKHRGAAVCRERRGKTDGLTCVYHQWRYDLKGKLTGVPFRRGIKGQGGMPKDFKLDEHNLDALKVSCYRGLIFGTFSDETPPLEEFLGKEMIALLDRVFHKPVKVLGYNKQVVPANWKLYAENTKDPYHASLLHLFHATFGLYRSTLKGGVTLDESGMHSAIFAKKGTDDESTLGSAFSSTRFQGLEAEDTRFKLEDPSILSGPVEFDDGISTLIMYLFPSLVVQQIGNTLATRKVIPHAPDKFELYWTYFGYADDDAELEQCRVKQANLIGPAGLISMEDGEATRLVQMTLQGTEGQHSVLEMGGRGPIETVDHLVSETSIRGMWENYCRFMGYEVSHDEK